MCEHGASFCMLWVVRGCRGDRGGGSKGAPVDVMAVGIIATGILLLVSVIGTTRPALGPLIAAGVVALVTLALTLANVGGPIGVILITAAAIAAGVLVHLRRTARTAQPRTTATTRSLAGTKVSTSPRPRSGSPSPRNRPADDTPAPTIGFRGMPVERVDALPLPVFEDHGTDVPGPASGNPFAAR